MFPAPIARVVLPCTVAVSIVLMLIRPRGISEVWWISGGALLLIMLRLVPLQLAGQAVAKGSDVYRFLIGMMLLSELARECGVFDWVASVAVRGARGSCSRLFVLVYGVGTLVTIFMSNGKQAGARGREARRELLEVPEDWRDRYAAGAVCGAGRSSRDANVDWALDAESCLTRYCFILASSEPASRKAPTPYT